MSNKVPKVVEEVLPAIVSITVSKDLDYREQLFGQSWGPSPFPQKKKKKMKVGGGSGFIVDEDGIILTNRHVVADPDAEYVVLFEDEEKSKAEILARDPINDIAVLKVKEDDLPTIKLGDSSEVKLGEQVIAIGNALGRFSNTVSTGIISGLSRNIKAQSPRKRQTQRLKNLIQTDAAVNPGNSGGPLVNMEGEAIGINAAMVHQAENIGFALPVNSTKRDLQEVKKYGRIRQPFLGVRYIPINKKLRKKYELPVGYGVLVTSGTSDQAVISGSPAAEAGLQPGDIILKCDGKEISSDQPLINLLHDCEINQETPFTVLRDDEEISFKVKLTEKK
ncbi:MAG: trypsin-like peptidase domain-containing protein [Candidatus Paceibacterota bacterium]